jgi:pimeloyl-ACP methyl ester carboxylesterase
MFALDLPGPVTRARLEAARLHTDRAFGRDHGDDGMDFADAVHTGPATALQRGQLIGLVHRLTRAGSDSRLLVRALDTSTGSLVVLVDRHRAGLDSSLAWVCELYQQLTTSDAAPSRPLSIVDRSASGPADAKPGPEWIRLPLPPVTGRRLRELATTGDDALLGLLSAAAHPSGAAPAHEPELQANGPPIAAADAVRIRGDSHAVLVSGVPDGVLIVAGGSAPAVAGPRLLAVRFRDGRCHLFVGDRPPPFATSVAAELERRLVAVDQRAVDPGAADRSVAVNEVHIAEHRVAVPLLYHHPEYGTICVRAVEVVRSGPNAADRPWLLFLQGGPGGAAPPADPERDWLAVLLESYRVLLLDQRGCGGSDPVQADWPGMADPRHAARVLAGFRADSIVRDAEALRRHLRVAEPWALLGQSYGGFIAHTYLSMFPDAVSKVMTSGGLPPIDTTADDLYRLTYRQLADRNREYFDRYPGDVSRWSALVRWCSTSWVELGPGEYLSERRLRLIGRRLGMSDGLERLHAMIGESGDAGSGHVATAFIESVRRETDYATGPLFALQEFVYARPGLATRWSADRVLRQLDDRTRSSVQFFGEMLFPWMFEEIAALRPYRAAANVLAEATDLPSPYDPARLAGNRVPIAALISRHDMYTPASLQLATAATVGSTRAWLSDRFQHNHMMRDRRVIESLHAMLTWPSGRTYTDADLPSASRRAPDPSCAYEERS